MDTRIAKLLFALLLLTLLQSGLSADFSRAQVELHPFFPGTGPFIIEISGTWPTDCHPGEQKPVVESFDGQTVEIGFEIIVVHITCNTNDTNYRVLVDMSEAVRASQPRSDSLLIQADFQGETLEQTVDLVCPEGSDCAGLAGEQHGVEPGLYYAPNLANQGLLAARQSTGMAIYPLVYDEAGRSEWLFTGNQMVGDSFFAEVLRLSGGDCFGCEPSGATPDKTTVGHLSALADRPGVLQVKTNDGLFVEYLSLVFGYRTFRVGPSGEQTLIDLEGRWGISENRGTDPPLGDLTEFFPGAFDLELEEVVPFDSQSGRAGQVSYLLMSPVGDTLGQVLCKGQIETDGTTSLCEFIDPTDAAEPLFLLYQQGPSRLAIEYGRPVIAVGTPPGGVAVRLD
jgi:hypothetical protein